MSPRPEDWISDPEAQEWARDVATGMAPMMVDSAMVVSLVWPGGGDVKFWVELGAAIMMNKPIIAVVLADAEVPPKLALVADEIVRMPDGVVPSSSEDLQAAIKRVVGRAETEPTDEP